LGTEPLWPAFASACVLASTTNHLLQPDWFLTEAFLRDERYSIHATWSLLPTEPFLPERLVYSNDGTEKYLAEDGQTNTWRYPSPYSNGFVEAEYTAITLTNVSHLTLPKEFAFTRYSSNPAGKTNTDLLKLCSFHGLVTNAGVEPELMTYAPTVSRDVFVSDKRVQSLSPPIRFVNYDIIDGRWRGLKEPLVLDRYQILAAERYRHSIKRTPVRSRGAVVLVLMLISMVFFPIVFRMMGKRATTNNKLQKGMTSL
jgi:hypothetical protein